MCRMMGVVSQGPVYYDIFEEFAEPWRTNVVPEDPDALDRQQRVVFQPKTLRVHQERQEGEAVELGP